MMPRRKPIDRGEPPDDDPLLTMKEVCTRIRHGEKTVRRQIAKGGFPPGIYLFGGPKPFWRKSVIEQWLREQGKGANDGDN